MGNGDITKKINVSVEKISKTAKEKIEKAGGTVDAAVGKNRKERKEAHAKLLQVKKNPTHK